MDGKPQPGTTDPMALFTQLESVISPARLSTYLARAGMDHERALADYNRNIALGEVFFGLFQWVEVILRNALHRQLCAKYGNTWYQTRPEVFGDPWGPKPGGKLRDAIDKLNHGQKQPWGAGDLVTELSFGFWTGILGREFEDLWRGVLRRAFPLGPAALKRKDVHIPLTAIRDLRNRITHHEPIVMVKLREKYTSSLQLISWVCPQTSLWLKQTYDPRIDALLPAARPPL